MKIPVIITDFFTIYTEAVQDDVFIHMDVLKWNKKIRSQFINKLDLVVVKGV